MLILPLQHPLVSLPGARISLTLPDDLAHQVADAPLGLTLAATPITNPKASDGSEKPVLNEWACAARVVRLIRPSVLNQSEAFIVTLIGRERVRVKQTRPFSFYSNDSDSGSDSSNGSRGDGRRRKRLPDFPVEYPPAETTPKREIITEFKGAALKLLDRLVQDAGKGSRREVWSKFATMVEEVSDTRTPWLADVMVWSIITDYNDRLGESSSVCVGDCLLKHECQLFSLWQTRMNASDTRQSCSSNKHLSQK